jgi:hypothetical protein
MSTELALPSPATGQAAAPGSRRRLAPALLVLVLVVGTAALAVALNPSGAPGAVDTALDRLRAWPSITVDGYLTGPSEPTRVRATITSDGTARGVAGRTLNAWAEFAAGPDGVLLRGNRQWWRDEPPAHAEELADHWVRNTHDGAVDQVARRLTPAALSDALASLRDPAGRTSAQVVVAGVPGTSFVRDGVRLVVDRHGAPLALSVRTESPSGLVAVRPADGEQTVEDPEPAWGLALTVRQADPADDAATRRAVSDASATAGTVPSQADVERRRPAEPVGISVVPDPQGCSRTDCGLTVVVTNRSSTPTTGLLVVRADGIPVASTQLALAPRTEARVSASIPAAVAFADPDRRVRIEASFASGGAVDDNGHGLRWVGV